MTKMPQSVAEPRPAPLVSVSRVVDTGGTALATRSFSTTRGDYRALSRSVRSFGDVRRIGVEGTGSYGAGITRHLTDAGIEVLEVDRPDHSDRHRKGKDDAVESLRVLHVTRQTAVRARRNALQQLRMLIVSAPDELRDQVRSLTLMQLIRTCAAWRPDLGDAADPVSANPIFAYGEVPSRVGTGGVATNAIRSMIAQCEQMANELQATVAKRRQKLHRAEQAVLEQARCTAEPEGEP